MRTEYKNLCDSNERQVATKRLITRGSSLYGPFSSNSARAIRSRLRYRGLAAL
ncbi:hypothetical protein ALC57_01486 [Trachymyrmex cornetzi]|uniref:Uncharacterized protein n=1 Tax=Trachymyrmex cornetzi TaxID=471704 RepID=A0A151JPM4_9HYME|nr:hypothetical protein ALC57_01486 [Trachymyrmex cornetzi]